MPQINQDDGANDESKTYHDEAIGGDEGHDLNDIKGDLVCEDDRDQIQPPFDQNNVNSHRGDEPSRSRKETRGHPNDLRGSGRDFPCGQQDENPLVHGLNPLLSNGFVSSSPPASYPPYMGPYMGSLFRGSSLDLESKQVSRRASRPGAASVYPLPGQLGKIPNPLSSWSPGSLYPLCTASAMAGVLRYPYPFASFSSSKGMGGVSPFPLVSPHPGIHPNILHPAALPFSTSRNNQNGVPKSISDKKVPGAESTLQKRPKSEKPNRPYVKKPLNAFMLYMKEQRAHVVAECTLKESAAINQILGRKWHSLKREEQQKYYEMARKERQVHMQMFPGWSARDNYGKRKKRKKEKMQDCSASCCIGTFPFQSCRHTPHSVSLRRKKKCVRYQQDDDEESDDHDSSPGQCQSVSGLSSVSCADHEADVIFSTATSAPDTIRSDFPIMRDLCNRNQALDHNRGVSSCSHSSLVDSSSSSSSSATMSACNQNIPMLPPGVNPVPPHSGFIPNFNCFSTVSLPPSPLSLIGLPNHRNLSSPLNMSIRNAEAPGSPVAAAPCRLAAAALEGRS